jgi:hypothetical protein
MPGQSIRFTPEEIKALMDAGEMNMDIIQALHPDDKKVWVSLANERTSGGSGFQNLTATMAGMGLGPAIKGMMNMFGRGGNVVKSSAQQAIKDGDITPITGGVDRFLKGPKPAYSSNINTESSMDDMMEMVTRSSSKGKASPLKFHESAPKGMRNSVDNLKRQVARRKPD